MFLPFRRSPFHARLRKIRPSVRLQRLTKRIPVCPHSFLATCLSYHFGQAPQRAQGEPYVCSSAPRACSGRQVDRQALPGRSMKPPNCAHAFQINKTTLAAPDINHRTMLDTLGMQLNLSAIVYGVLGNLNCHFRCNWCSFANLMILSFQSGTQVNKTTMADDLAILLPVVDDPLATCRKQVRFVCVFSYISTSPVWSLRASKVLLS